MLNSAKHVFIKFRMLKSIHAPQAEYAACIEKIMHTPLFHTLYRLYYTTGVQGFKPSLDHTIPKSAGGCTNASNLCVMSLVENLMKNRVLHAEWSNIEQHVPAMLHRKSIVVR